MQYVLYFDYVISCFAYIYIICIIYTYIYIHYIICLCAEWLSWRRVRGAALGAVMGCGAWRPATTFRQPWKTVRIKVVLRLFKFRYVWLSSFVFIYLFLCVVDFIRFHHVDSVRVFFLPFPLRFLDAWCTWRTMSQVSQRYQAGARTNPGHDEL